MLEKFKARPDRRRFVVSAWPVADIHGLALPPGHP